MVWGLLLPLFVCSLQAGAGFPTDEWMTWYQLDGNGSRLLGASATLTIPSQPSLPLAPESPGWWMAIVPSGNRDRYIRTTMAWGNFRSAFSGFSEFYDDNTHAYWQGEALHVLPGDTIAFTIAYNASRRQYDLTINASTIITQFLNLIEHPNDPFSDLLIGMENKPASCQSLPQSNRLRFRAINARWADRIVSNCSGVIQHQDTLPCDIKARCIQDDVEFLWNARDAVAMQHNEL